MGNFFDADKLGTTLLMSDFDFSGSDWNSVGSLPKGVTPFPEVVGVFTDGLLAKLSGVLEGLGFSKSAFVVENLRVTKEAVWVSLTSYKNMQSVEFVIDLTKEKAEALVFSKNNWDLKELDFSEFIESSEELLKVVVIPEEEFLLGLNYVFAEDIIVPIKYIEYFVGNVDFAYNAYTDVHRVAGKFNNYVYKGSGKIVKILEKVLDNVLVFEDSTEKPVKVFISSYDDMLVETNKHRQIPLVVDNIPIYERVLGYRVKPISGVEIKDFTTQSLVESGELTQRYIFLQELLFESYEVLQEADKLDKDHAHEWLFDFDVLTEVNLEHKLVRELVFSDSGIKVLQNLARLDLLVNP